MSACGWGSGGSVGRTFPTQKLAALHTADGRSVGLLRLKSFAALRTASGSVGRVKSRSFPCLVAPPPTRSPLSHAPLSSHRVTARRRCAMPVCRSDGCLSTTQCHGMCVQKPVTFSSPSGCTFTQCSLPGPDQKALRVTVFTARRRCAMPALVDQTAV